jgi:hypothetical protein
MRLARRLAMLNMALVCSTGVAGPVTYDFTGVVTQETLDAGVFSSVPIGAVVTGTFSFDYYKAPDEGSIGSTFFFVSTISGAQNDSPSQPLLFSSTALVDGLSYRSNSQAQYLSDSAISGGASDQPVELSASEVTQSTAGSRFLASDVSFDSYSSAGLPVFSATFGGTGDFSTGFLEGLAQRAVDVDSLSYTITSLTLAPAVPEPSEYAMLVVGLAMLSFVGWRHGRACDRCRSPVLLTRPLPRSF